jgi:hypothetical protein
MAATLPDRRMSVPYVSLFLNSWLLSLWALCSCWPMVGRSAFACVVASDVRVELKFSGVQCCSGANFKVI